MANKKTDPIKKKKKLMVKFVTLTFRVYRSSTYAQTEIQGKSPHFKFPWLLAASDPSGELKCFFVVVFFSLSGHR